MEYIDNNAYAILEDPDSEHDMWDFCFIQLCSYGKHDEPYPDLETGRIKSQVLYEELLNRVWHNIGADHSELAPREWPELSFL